MSPPLDDFRPPRLLANAHVQTLLGYFLPGPRLPAAARHVLRLPDGDALVLYDNAPPGWRDGGPLALILHGLGGCGRSRLVQRYGVSLLRRGARVVRMDLRGAGLGLALARRPYNAGLSADVRAVLHDLHRRAPASPLLLLGLSLGGNLALKAASEADLFPLPGLARVAAVCPPIDLERCADLIARPHNRLYDRHYSRQLRAQAERRQALFPDLPPLNLPRRLTLRLFDDLYTAPRSGFADALDYYRRSSAAPLLGRVRVPTLILTSRDDPFIDPTPFEELRPPPHFHVRIAERGGHLGFIGGDGAGGFRWAEGRVADWLLRTS
jgi:predicted alpha/beta-fold hydrolase